MLIDEVEIGREFPGVISSMNQMLVEEIFYGVGLNLVWIPLSALIKDIYNKASCPRRRMRLKWSSVTPNSHTAKVQSRNGEIVKILGMILC